MYDSADFECSFHCLSKILFPLCRLFARECFSGCGIFSTALESTGVWESKQYDLELGHDLLDRKWRQTFSSDIKNGKTKHWHFGVDCRTFSMAAHNNQVRDKAWPLGKPDLNDVNVANVVVAEDARATARDVLRFWP